MKPAQQRNAALALGGVCAGLGLALLVMGMSASSLQNELRTLQAQFEGQQEQINSAITIQQRVLPSLFNDLAQSPEDITFKALLAKHGPVQPDSK